MIPIITTLSLWAVAITALVLALKANGVATPAIIGNSITDSTGPITEAIVPPTIICPTTTANSTGQPAATKPITHDCIVYEQHGDLFVYIRGNDAGSAVPIWIDNHTPIINTGDVIKVKIINDYAYVIKVYDSIYDTNFYDLNACSKGTGLIRRSVKHEETIGGKPKYTATIGRNKIVVYGHGLKNGVIYEMWLIEKGYKTVGLVTHGA